MSVEKNRLRLQKKWAMYDWANSVYSLIMTSTFLPEYYVHTTSNQKDNVVHFLGMNFINTSLYSYALAFSFLLIAVMSPILAAIVDSSFDRKKFLRFFLILGSTACFFLYFFTTETLSLGIGMIIISCIGYWGSLVFYNSYLPEIATPKEADAVSAMGYKYGYIGSFILQVICLGMVIFHDMFGVESEGMAVRLSFIMVWLWWLGFGMYSVAALPSSKPYFAKKSEGFSAIVKRSYQGIFTVAKEAFKMMLLRRFLLAYLFFNMGIQVVMLVATIYGSKELEITAPYLITTIIIIQLLAILGADLAAWSSKKSGNLITLLILCLMWIGVCIIAYFLEKGDFVGFCLLGGYVGLLMGGSQSLNRSTYSKIIPKTIFNTTYFSLYDTVEKFSIVFGMFFFAYIEELTGSMRHSVIIITIFFVLGALFLYITYQRSKKHNLLIA